MTTPKLIGLDWGTTSFRAFLMTADGRILDAIDTPSGIMQVAPGTHDEVLTTATCDWIARHGRLPMVASGMITSRQGWVETPYLGTPAGAEDLAAGLTPHALSSGAVVHFVPGLLMDDDTGAPDVMRGEETEIVGCAVHDRASGLFVMPGTHSKWARVDGGRIASFSTFMTGEVYGALRDHTILGRLMGGASHPVDPLVFRRGVAASLDPTGGEALLHTLFGVRTLPLTDRLADEAVADYLSGLIIGHELRTALKADMAGGEDTITLVGRGALVERYALALDAAGRTSRRAPDNMAAAGLLVIAKAGGLIDD